MFRRLSCDSGGKTGNPLGLVSKPPLRDEEKQGCKSPGASNSPKSMSYTLFTRLPQNLLTFPEALASRMEEFYR